jgi:hypothetical protein
MTQRIQLMELQTAGGKAVFLSPCRRSSSCSQQDVSVEFHSGKYEFEMIFVKRHMSSYLFGFAICMQGL